VPFGTLSAIGHFEEHAHDPSRARRVPLTFPEQAAELRCLKAVAMSLSLSGAKFEHILREVTATAGAAGATPAEQLATIRVRILATTQTRTPRAMAGLDLSHVVERTWHGC